LRPGAGPSPPFVGSPRRDVAIPGYGWLNLPEKVAASSGAERANRGILITTSYFGKDAYDFAKDKNLTLLDGSELLGLLEKHGYKFRIDLKEARTRMGLSPRE
jgi:hypothetical protein